MFVDEQFNVTLGKSELYHNITEQIQGIVSGWELQDGHIDVFVEHTTCAVVLQEDEPCLIEDIFDRLDEIAPVSLRDIDSSYSLSRAKGHYYRHDNLKIRTVNLDPSRKERINGHAHVRALFFPQSLVLRIRNGQIHLGRWQQVLFFDFDGLGDRQERTILVSVMSYTKHCIS